MTQVDQPLEEWAVSRALFKTGLLQGDAREKKKKKSGILRFKFCAQNVCDAKIWRFAIQILRAKRLRREN